VNLLPTQCDSSFDQVDQQTIDRDLRRGCACILHRTASPDSPDACFQFFHVKGFGQIVICASVEGREFASFVVPN
jgi:hypothetical protein